MSETVDFEFFINRLDSITKDQPINFTHTRNSKLCKCGILNLFIREEDGIILQSAFSGPLSIPTQVMADAVCCMVQGKKATDAIKLNFIKGLGYQPNLIYQKCFHRFIIHTLVFLLRDVIENSSSDNPEA